MNKLVAIVGMAGSGKSEVTKVFEEHGFKKIRFGDLTDEEIARRKLELNESNERIVRQQLREEHGMAAYAILNMSKIASLLSVSDVVIDGLYSWEEYVALKSHYGSVLQIVAVWSSPEMRYERLSKRLHRPLIKADAIGRDTAEIEKSNKGGPIAMADYTIINDFKLENLRALTEKVVSTISWKK